METTEIYALGFGLTLIGACAVFGLVALLAEWLLPGLATSPTFARLLLWRIESTRGNRVRMALNFILTAVFFALAFNLHFIPAVVVLVAWLPLVAWAIWATLRSVKSRAA